MFPRSEATNAVTTDVVASLIRWDTRLKNAGLRKPGVSKVLHPHPEQTHRPLNLASQSVHDMNNLTVPIVPKLIAFATHDVDGAIIVEIVQESI